MSTKAKRVIFWLAAVIAILLLAGTVIPQFLLARFVYHEFFTIRIQVTDKATGKPIASAEVWIRGRDTDVKKALGLQGAITDTNGQCQFQHGFRATGFVGRSGQFHINNRSLLVVKTAEFPLWERPLDAVFGSSRDYYQKSREMSYAVTLEK